MGTDLRSLFVLVLLCLRLAAAAPDESLAQACVRGDVAAAAARLRAGDDVNQVLADNETPLLLAAHQGSAALMRLLLKAGAKPTALRWNGETLLHAAVSSGQVEAVEVALAQGLDGNAGDARRGQTALHYAAAEGRTEIAKVLLAHGAAVNARSKTGVTPLWMAVQASHKETAAVLLAGGADVALEGPSGYRAVHLAARSCQAPVLAEVLAAHADPNAAAEGGVTPLHVAVMQSCLPAVKALVAAGAEVEAKTDKGQTPLEFARRRRMKEILAFFDEWKSAHPTQEQTAEK